MQVGVPRSTACRNPTWLHLRVLLYNNDSNKLIRIRLYNNDSNKLIRITLIRITQVGVPRSIAYNMTFPDIVSKHNIDSMRLLVQV